MNPIKIEKGAIEALKRTIRLHDRMDEFLEENDKGPSWDGDIILYSDSDLKVEHIQYRIPTQVKGKNDEKLLKRNSITYPVQYKNLRNYFNDGGICYFVIVISDNGERTAIFCSALTPIKLQAVLKGTEKNGPEQTKNIVLKRLKNSDKNELYKILLQFGHDSKEQGAGELVRRAISLNDMGKIDSMRMTTFATDNEEAIRNMKSGEACLFAHVVDADIWLPLSYDLQRQMEWIACRNINETFGVDGIPYYDDFKLKQNMDKTYMIQLSDNLSIDMEKNKVSFEPSTELEQIITDVKFLKIMQKGKSLFVGKKKLCNYDKLSYGEELQRELEDFNQIQAATVKFKISLNKRFGDFTDGDWIAINELVNIYQGKIRPKGEIAWHMWWWQGKVVPFFMAKGNAGEVFVENGICMGTFQITARGENGEYPVPAFINFKRDVWEKLYDVDENILLEEIEKGEMNLETQGNFSLLLVEVLSAYDLTKNEKYYDMAKLISDKLLEVDPENDYWKINKFQLLKRKRKLSEEELLDLEHMEEENDDKKVICAVNILLDNKRRAQKELDKMEEDDKEAFKTYPIYRLL